MKKQAVLQKKRALLPLILSAVLVVALLIGGAITYARLIGAGNGKSVIYSTEQHFSSNVLRPATSELSALRTIVRCGDTGQPIALMNYDLANFASDEFDLRYEVTCYITSYDAEDLYTYAIRTPGSDTPTDISLTSKAAPFVFEGTLKGGTRSVDNFDVLFLSKSGESNTELPPSASVCVVAVPIAPDFMSTSYLGATISKSEEEFFVVGYFENDGTAVGDLAGFLYNVSASGFTTERELVRLRWDPAALALSGNHRLAGLCHTESDGFMVLEYSPKREGDNIVFSFYRTDEWGIGNKKDDEGEDLLDAGGDPIPYRFNESTTWQDIKALISATAVIAS